MRQWIKLAGLCLLLLCGMVNANEVFVTYYHNDHLGSPVAATDETGNLLWREHYRPYGERQDRPGYQGYGTLGFTGHAQNQANGLVYAGARYYDPLIGRFLSVDPKEASEETPGSFNRYAYSLNNPYGYSDPDGRWVAAALGVLDAGLTIHGIYSEYRSGGVEAAQAEVGKAVAAHLVGGLAGNVLRRGYILAKEGSIAAKEVPNVKWSAQEKHFPGHNSYIPGRSILTSDPRKLAKSAGSGVQVGDMPVGTPGSKERINFGASIGTYIDGAGVATSTSNGIIHYSKDGIHIVPARP